VQGSRRNPLDLRHPGRVFAAVAFTIVAIDQIAKFVVRARLFEGQSRALLAGVLNLTYVHNVGAAFGLFPGRQPVFIATSCFVLFVVAAYWRRAKPREWPVVIALAMVCAGALGNLIDRAVLGQVTDFFEFAFVQFPVFNVADMAIVGGVAVLAIWILFPAEGEGDPPVEEGAPVSGPPTEPGASS
jgi:signal peptidase II